MEKRCIRCGEVKPLSSFYKHKQMKDGHLNICKECKKTYAKKREKELRQDDEWVEKEKARAREKYHRLGYREKHKPTPEYKAKIMKGYYSKYPEKRKATSKVNSAIRDGRLTRFGEHAHHWSYKEEHWLDVIWLSNKEHARIHRDLEYSREHLCYKTKDGGLLDTKEKHLNFCRSDN